MSWKSLRKLLSLFLAMTLFTLQSGLTAGIYAEFRKKTDTPLGQERNLGPLAIISAVITVVEIFIEIFEAVKKDGEDSDLKQSLANLNDINNLLATTKKSLADIDDNLDKLHETIKINMARIRNQVLLSKLEDQEAKIQAKWQKFDQFFYSFNLMYETDADRQAAIKDGTFKTSYVKMMSRFTDEYGMEVTLNLDEVMDSWLYNIKDKMCGNLQSVDTNSLICNYVDLLKEQMVAGARFEDCTQSLTLFMIKRLAYQQKALAMAREWIFAKYDRYEDGVSAYKKYESKYIAQYLKPQFDLYLKSVYRLAAVHIDTSSPGVLSQNAKPLINEIKDSGQTVVYSESIVADTLLNANLINALVLKENRANVTVMGPEYELINSTNPPKVSSSTITLTGDTPVKTAVLPGYLYWQADGKSCMLQQYLACSRFSNTEISTPGTYSYSIQLAGTEVKKGDLSVNCYDRKTGQTATGTTADADKFYFGFSFYPAKRNLPVFSFSTPTTTLTQEGGDAPRDWHSVTASSTTLDSKGTATVTLLAKPTGWIYHFKSWFTSLLCSNNFTFTSGDKSASIQVSGETRLSVRSDWAFTTTAKVKLGISLSDNKREKYSDFSKELNCNNSNDGVSTTQTATMVVNDKEQFSVRTCSEIYGDRFPTFVQDNKSSEVSYGIYNNQLNVSFSVTNVGTSSCQTVQASDTGKTGRRESTEWELVEYYFDKAAQVSHNIRIQGLPTGNQWVFLIAADIDQDHTKELFLLNTDDQTIYACSMDYDPETRIGTADTPSPLYTPDEGFVLSNADLPLFEQNHQLSFVNEEAGTMDLVKFGLSIEVSRLSLPQTDLQNRLLTDLNKNGVAELLYFQKDINTFEIYEQNEGMFTRTSTGSAPGGRVRGIADFDGNGTDDILWECEDDESLVFMTLLDKNLCVSGAGIPEIKGNPGFRNFRIQDTGDYNGDGKCDILWSRTSQSGHISLYVSFMDGLRSVNPRIARSGIVRIGKLKAAEARILP